MDASNNVNVQGMSLWAAADAAAAAQKVIGHA